jgi:hypothetical protein
MQVCCTFTILYFLTTDMRSSTAGVFDATDKSICSLWLSTGQNAPSHLESSTWSGQRANIRLRDSWILVWSPGYVPKGIQKGLGPFGRHRRTPSARSLPILGQLRSLSPYNGRDDAERWNASSRRASSAAQIRHMAPKIPRPKPQSRRVRQHGPACLRLRIEAPPLV